MLQAKRFFFMLVPLFMAAASVHASVVTLGQSALMSLDYHYLSETLAARVVDKRPSAGGVEFDIRFSGNSGLDSQLFYSSSVFGGSGALVFEDISSFDAFQLDVQLLEVQGYSPQQAEGFELWFSPMVYDSDSYKFFNSELLSTAPGSNAATASMDIASLAAGFTAPGDWIFEIGYEVHMDDPTAWPANGATVTLLISPTTGATQLIPEPGSLSILGLGLFGLMIKRKRMH